IVQQVNKVGVVQLEPVGNGGDRAAAALGQGRCDALPQVGVDDFTNADHANRSYPLNRRNRHGLTAIVTFSETFPALRPLFLARHSPGACFSGVTRHTHGISRCTWNIPHAFSAGENGTCVPARTLSHSNAIYQRRPNLRLQLLSPHATGATTVGV